MKPIIELFQYPASNEPPTHEIIVIIPDAAIMLSTSNPIPIAYSSSLNNPILETKHQNPNNVEIVACPPKTESIAGLTAQSDL